MSAIDNFPMPVIVRYFDRLLSRSMMWSPSKDLREVPGTVMMYPTVEEARLIWAAQKWLEIYKDIGVGVEETKFQLKDCIEMLSEKVSEMKLQGEEKTVTFSRRELRILSDTTMHLDRFAMSHDVPAKRSKPKGARKK